MLLGVIAGSVSPKDGDATNNKTVKTTKTKSIAITVIQELVRLMNMLVSTELVSW